MIASRISDLSENKEIFSSEAPVYNEALKMAGYNEELQYSRRQKEKTNRKRKVLWFNPPWNDEVSTNVAKKFLSMVEKHFPRGSQYHKYFNRNTIKVSYCTMPNMARIIAAHNKKVTRPSPTTEIKQCNCRNPQHCILDGQCLTENVIYNTALSAYTWELKQKNIPHTHSWSIVELAPSYSRSIRSCSLCLTEKTIISTMDKNLSLNKRNEIISKCRHRDKLLLKHW